MAGERLGRRITALGVALGLMTACATPVPLRQALGGFGRTARATADNAVPETLYALRPLPSLVSAVALYRPEERTVWVLTDEGGFCRSLTQRPDDAWQPLGACRKTAQASAENGPKRIEP